MKKSVFILASLTWAAMVYAQPQDFSREDVLDVFARFNPAVLEKAKQNAAYNQILDSFLSSYRAEKNTANWYELIAAVRNFDASIQLNVLTETYHRLWLAARVSGIENQVARRAFLADITDTMEKIWAVTVQLRTYQLEQANQQFKQIREDKQRQQDQAHLTREMASLKAELRALQQNPGAQIISAAQNYVDNAEAQFAAQSFTVERQAAEQAEQQARQTTNLQIKSNHKKPVAE